MPLMLFIFIERGENAVFHINKITFQPIFLFFKKNTFHVIVYYYYNNF